jgi:hypothetical protein
MWRVSRIRNENMQAPRRGTCNRLLHAAGNTGRIGTTSL